MTQPGVRFSAVLNIYTDTDAYTIIAGADSMDELLERLGTQTDTLN